MASGATTQKGFGVNRSTRAGIDAVGRTAIAQLAIRVALALPMIYHGSGIALGLFGGPGLKGFAGFTHMPLAVAALVGYGELLAGLGVLFGVFTRVAALGTAIIMLGAILMVHLPHGFDSTKGGFEFPLALLLISVALVVAGGGRYSLMHCADDEPGNGPKAESVRAGS